jgi:hypothetical protein
MADSSQNRSGVANFEYLTVRDEEQDGESETVPQESQRGSPALQRDGRSGATESELLRKRKEKDKILQNLTAMKSQAESLAKSLAKQCEEVSDAVDRYQTTFCPTLVTLLYHTEQAVLTALGAVRRRRPKKNTLVIRGLGARSCTSVSGIPCQVQIMPDQISPI